MSIDLNADMQASYLMVEKMPRYTNRAKVLFVGADCRNIKAGDTVLYCSGAEKHHTGCVDERGEVWVLHVSEILAVLRPIS